MSEVEGNYLTADKFIATMFKEARQAINYAQLNKWPAARKHLDVGTTIMWDHKVPTSIIEAGYADDLELIKANPTSKELISSV